jgi:hypothetical protein
MPAVANAVYDALRVRVDEVPVTPDKVLKALESRTKRCGPTSYPDLRIRETMRVKTPEEGGDGSSPRPERGAAKRGVSVP